MIQFCDHNHDHDHDHDHDQNSDYDHYHVQLGHYMLAQYLGAFLGAALVFFTYKVNASIKISSTSTFIFEWKMKFSW